jgi:NAD(P)H-flavin reductase
VGIDIRKELMAIAPPVALSPEHIRVEPVAASFDDFVVAQVVATRLETADTVTLTLAGADPAFSKGSLGQFAMVAIPGFPPLPISISRFTVDGIELTIRGAGPATKAMCALKVGDQLGLRGPLGNNWPIDRAVGRDLVIVTGGIGLAPLRPVIHALAADRRRFGDQAGWEGANAIAFVCGPERMMQATANTLAGRGVTTSRIFVTLERHMECGIGLCGHCQMGKYFVCRDGPVFSLAQLGDTFGREGI